MLIDMILGVIGLIFYLAVDSKISEVGRIMFQCLSS